MRGRDRGPNAVPFLGHDVEACARGPARVMIAINGHEVRLDEEQGLLPWRDYGNVVSLAMEFIRHCPIDPATGLPWYLAYSCFWTDPLRPVDWPDNPAAKFGMASEALLRYYAYSGQGWAIEVLKSMLDRLIEFHTPSSYAWPQVPFASGEPGAGVYRGARADGQFVTEPDKIAQAALGYLALHKVTGAQDYLFHARGCADVLAEKVQPGDERHSPWPFRVDIRDGRVIEAYCSHSIAAIRLFDELLQISPEASNEYRRARQMAWNWLVEYPLRTNVWKGYFEDIRLDPEDENRDQYSPLETARYLLTHPEMDPEWEFHARGLIEWVRSTLGADPFFKAVAVHEQLYCYHVMGSHTARYAGLCGLLAERTGDNAMAERSRRSFNWSTYMADDEGLVRVGIDPPDYYNQCWFTDGYFDYVPHFIDGMACMPETAPANADHLLRSSSVIQQITYAPRNIRYRSFDAESVERLRLTFAPQSIRVGGEMLLENEVDNPKGGWKFDPGLGVLDVHHFQPDVEISGVEEDRHL
jgi:hypothetical protein